MTPKPATAVDTSVAVPLLVASHEHHEMVAGWAHGKVLALCGHAFFETYAVLTRLPGDARLAAADAVTLIDECFAPPLLIPARDARATHRRLAEHGIAGGATYDGLIALAARVHRAMLVTRDARARSTYEALGIDVELLVVADR